MTAATTWELDREHDTSAMEDTAGLRAVQQAVAAETSPGA
jgi:hypothetical protein